ncbi:hypothetical protein EV700_1424 [Fluviicoccus keumensis]|uniref:Lipoprotein n=1 Tax=Fluviicoccus keumensis TaxID=1435465 RepID=A0A4Q7ZAU7_9GAMM|nr:hypothetical protein [Fluviicoccus keumensis]RZU47035.1 hypothetical protein EV700_1424 [Fluviicoccus keumensis]
MNRILVTMTVLMAGLLSACEATQGPGTSEAMKSPVVLTVPGLLATAKRYQGMVVQVRGFDAGWQGECRSAPPVSRSDWHLQDGGKCLYVHGPHPEPRADGDKPRLVKVNGVVRVTPEGVWYLDAP